MGCRHESTLMKKKGIEARYRRPNTSRKSSKNPVFPYLLSDLEIAGANRVWAMEIPCIPLRKGCMYLVAVLDRAGSPGAVMAVIQ